jgi:Phage derived protein Gp49-like (DUF891)
MSIEKQFIDFAVASLETDRATLSQIEALHSYHIFLIMIQIRDYLDERGTNPICTWMASQSEKARGAIEARLVWMSTTPIPWATQYVYKLKDQDPIWEVRVKHSSQQYRPLGYFGPGSDQFTLLIGAKEKSGRFEPAEAVKTAKVRVGRLKKGQSKTCEHFRDQES